MDIADLQSIRNIMAQYFDGLYRADAEVLGQIFHQDLGYVNATGEAFVAKGRTAYLQDVAGRTPPDKMGDRRNPAVLQIQAVSESVVFVRASMTMKGRHYDDALTLIDTPDGWQIVAKVFSQSSIEDEPCLT